MDFEAPLWEYDGEAAWWFVTVPPEVSEDLRVSPRPPKGFGSIRVEVTVGSSTWRTSVFPDKASGCFLLPVKKAVREAEALDAGEPVPVHLAVVTDE
jgi:hypothetical protein